MRCFSLLFLKLIVARQSLRAVTSIVNQFYRTTNLAHTSLAMLWQHDPYVARGPAKVFLSGDLAINQLPPGQPMGIPTEYKVFSQWSMVDKDVRC